MSWNTSQLAACIAVLNEDQISELANVLATQYPIACDQLNARLHVAQLSVDLQHARIFCD